MTRQWLNGPCLLLGISRISSFRLALQGRFLTRTWDHPMNRAEAAMATQQVTEKRPGKNSNYSSYSNYSNYSNCKKNECQRSRPLHVLRPVSFRTLRKCARRKKEKRHETNIESLYGRVTSACMPPDVTTCDNPDAKNILICLDCMFRKPVE